MMGSAKLGPSPEYMQLLNGEITSEEYVRIVKQQVKDGLAPKPVTLHQADLHRRAAVLNFYDTLVAALPQRLRRLLGV